LVAALSGFSASCEAVPSFKEFLGRLF
jgi:hypothetical protein